MKSATRDECLEEFCGVSHVWWKWQHLFTTVYSVYSNYQVDRNIENLEIMQGTSSVIILPVFRFIGCPDIWLWINTYKYHF